MSAPKYCPDPDRCEYSDCPTAFCDRKTKRELAPASGSACHIDHANERWWVLRNGKQTCCCCGAVMKTAPVAGGTCQEIQSPKLEVE